jgi:uncharacterized membrane protein
MLNHSWGKAAAITRASATRVSRLRAVAVGLARLRVAVTRQRR